jgi:hypothetical protein
VLDVFDTVDRVIDVGVRQDDGEDAVIEILAD